MAASISGFGASRLQKLAVKISNKPFVRRVTRIPKRKLNIAEESVLVRTSLTTERHVMVSDRNSTPGAAIVAPENCCLGDLYQPMGLTYQVYAAIVRAAIRVIG